MGADDFALCVLSALGDGDIHELYDVGGVYFKGHTSSKGSTKCLLHSMTALACLIVILCLEHREKNQY